MACLLFLYPPHPSYAATSTISLTCQLRESGAATETWTASGGSVSPTSGSCTPAGGTETTLTATTSSTVTITVQADGSTTRYRFNSSATTPTTQHITAPSSGNKNVAIWNYYQLSNTLDVDNNPNHAFADATWNTAVITILGEYTGVAGSTICSITLPGSGNGPTQVCANGWLDYDFFYQPQTSTSNAANTQWACGPPSCPQVSSGVTTSGNIFTYQYWFQYSIVLKVNALPVPVTFSGSEQFSVVLNQTDANETVSGSPSASCSSGCVLSDSPVWADYGSLMHYVPVYSVSNTERWYLKTGAATGSNGKCVGISGCGNELLPGGTYSPKFTLQYELTGNSNFLIQSVNSLTPSDGPLQMAWIFGYQNNGLIGLSPATSGPQWPSTATATAAEEASIQNLTNVFGSNVADVRAVDMSNGAGGHFPTSGAVFTAEQQYVAAMEATGATVFCRFSFDTQALNTSPSSNAVVSFALLSQSTTTTAYPNGGLGCDGVWFDLAASYANGGGGLAGTCSYDGGGQYCFSHMMQNLTNTYPSATWLLQQNSPGKHIIPLGNDTWQDNTWIMIDVTPGTGVSTGASTLKWLTEAESQMAISQQYFGNQVFLHWDNSGGIESEPMGLFAQNATALEELTVNDAIGNMSNYGEDVLVPFFGGSYYNAGGSTCQFYNSYSVPVNSAYYNSYAVTPPCNRASAPNFGTSMLQHQWYDYGTSISITVYGNFGIGGGERYVVTSYNWDGGSNTPESGSGTFTVTETMTATHEFELNVQPQYTLTLSVSPVTCGFTTPSAGTYWENSGANVGGISVRTQTGCTFSSWTGSGSGSYTGTANPTSVTMNAAISEIAGFTGQALPTCTIADTIVGNGTSSFLLLGSLFFVMAAGTVIMGIVMFREKDPNMIAAIVFVALLLGTVIIASAIIYGATTLANDTTLNTFNCVPQ